MKTPLKNFHQGAAVTKWIEQHYNNKNYFAKMVAEISEAKNPVKKQNSIYTLCRQISQFQFISAAYHKRWDREVAPYNKHGLTLSEILEDMGEKEAERARGMVADIYQRELWKAQGKIEAYQEDYIKLLKQNRDLFAEVSSLRKKGR